VEIFQQWHARGKGSNRGSGSSAFTMQVDSETPQSGNPIRGIRNLTLPVNLERVRRQRGDDCRFDIRAVEWFGIDPPNGAFEQDASGRAGNEQQIASALCYQNVEPTIELFGGGGAYWCTTRAVVQFAGRANRSCAASRSPSGIQRPLNFGFRQGAFANNRPILIIQANNRGGQHAARVTGIEYER